MLYFRFIADLDTPEVGDPLGYFAFFELRFMYFEDGEAANQPNGIEMLVTPDGLDQLYLAFADEFVGAAHKETHRGLIVVLEAGEKVEVLNEITFLFVLLHFIEEETDRIDFFVISDKRLERQLRVPSDVGFTAGYEIG